MRRTLACCAAMLIAGTLGCSGSNAHGDGGAGNPDGGSGTPEACSTSPSPSGSWSAVAVPAGANFTNVSGSSSTDVWIVGPHTVLSWNGQSWTSAALPQEPTGGAPFAGLAVPQTGDVWVGSAFPANWNGTQWTTFNPGVSTQVNAVWGSSYRDVWGSMGGQSSEGYMGHYDGQAWSQVGPALALDGIWGSSSKDIWGVGVDTDASLGRPYGIFHWVGVYAGTANPALMSLTQSQLTPGAMHAVWGTSSTEAWAGGDSGELYHWDGSAWTALGSAPTSASIRGIWGDCSNDYWAVGDSGALMHFDGSSWTAQPGVTSANLTSVWGSGGGDVWAVGGSGTVLHFSP